MRTLGVGSFLWLLAGSRRWRSGHLFGTELQPLVVAPKWSQAWSRYLLAAFCLVWLPGCEEDAPWAACEPPPALQTLGPPAEDGAEASVKRIAVYLDVSESMKGFTTASVSGAAVSESIYRDVVADLPNVAERLAEEVSLYFYGTEIKGPLPHNDFVQAGRQPNWYTGKPINNNGDLRLVFDAIAEAPEGTVSIIVTDLFLSAKDLDLGASRPLWRPMQRMLSEKGTAVGLVAVRNPFDGTIYDLPAGGTNRIDYTGNRPFFIVVVGDEATVRRSISFIKEDILSGVPTEHYRLAIFAPMSVKKAGVVDLSRSSDRLQLSGEAIRSSGLVRGLDTAGQVVLQSDQASIVASVAVDEFFESYSLPPGTIKPQATLFAHFRKPGERVCEQRWTQQTLTGPIVQTELKDGRYRVTFLLSSAHNLLLPDTLYFIDIQLVADPPANAGLPSWLHEWSFDSSEVGSLVTEASAGQANHPTFFPALNLSRLGEAMLEVVRQNSRPVEFAQLQLAVKKE